MFLDTLVVGPLQENSYVVACEETQEAVIIDPGAEAERIYRVVTFHGFTLKYVMNTHGHIDHVGGVAEILEETGVPFLIHEDERDLIKGIENDPLQAYLRVKAPPLPETFLHDGDCITVGTLEFQVLHTPGHTPGGVCFLTGEILFCGDTLFSNSIGRTDLPGGNHNQLLTSIREKLLPLEDHVKVYPGHGTSTTIGSERQFNPFLR
ncbi:MBL fold metallo-hydrolase [candidate division KSB3 bacterium]|uniref:MBL fold metallo-hydrolase n=1 Tax=candidate division KSB3 bacterium TaxID=2044937 RepID=A0A9D5JSV7_9BACT|nr:MBL fold metallo-hydrolase [candidate division KSB3 bacterium]MBD3322991.1 MBL fold metallo-hydrolase [candidate division KSB3 bacterium]